MKRILMAAAATIALTGSAFADTTTINATVAGVCVLPAGDLAVVNDATITTDNTAANAFSVNITGANSPAFSVTSTHTGAYCNNNATIAISNTNGYLRTTTHPAVVAGTFVYGIGYSVATTWAALATGSALPSKEKTTGAVAADTPPALDPSTNGGHAMSGAIFGDIIMTFTGTVNSAPVLKGTYSDVVTLTISTTA